MVGWSKPEIGGKGRMNSKTKRRMAVVTGIIVIVLIVVLAVVGGSSSAKTVTLAEAASGTYAGSDKTLQVTGNVVENSFSTEGNVLTFDIYDPDGDAAQKLHVIYDGGVSATFGNDVVAICTGKVQLDGTLRASQLVTKCPSKYENASDALTVSKLLGYGEKVLDKPVKVAGTLAAGSLSPAGSSQRFVLQDASGAQSVPVRFDGALSDDVTDGASLVVTGSLSKEGLFTATEVALEG